ncbi:transport protein Avl9-domain-containing protein [Schizophyllum amplum]|uniref:Transport protein Avl9-domain-containing protein n=1 Tax=Schizophyllum amplum TaxID=97359 RepID=A0A550CGH0_9AGAR|nr:transport protein Avl9-domain-containing protein [Auriculariopsis ampla]
MSADPEPHSPSLEAANIANFLQPDDDDETASQRSISLSSPAASARNSTQGHVYASSRDSTVFSKRDSHPYTLSSDLSSEVDERGQQSPVSTANTSIEEEPATEADAKAYAPPISPDPAEHGRHLSIASTGSSSRKARPESMLVLPGGGPIILGIALVDFNHIVGPKIEYSRGDILPFLALPDGAHLSAEDYSYFHLVPTGPKPTTVFGISCNQQIAASALQAVVVLASKPIFGPIRDKLGVVTTALFHQRDFTDLSILDAFGESLEASLRSQMTESGLLMGTSLRELVHTFRQRTLVLVKTLMLQKRIMFSGYPVERLCTYQYSLISLIPGCGSPPIAARAPTLSKPTSLKTSDRKSMMAYLGFPLDIFGKDSFFQPYIPLQQLDMLKDTPTWLCGSTNSIVTQQNCVTCSDGIVDAGDRKWMDDIVQAVNEGYAETEDGPMQPAMQVQIQGSDDYLRVKFEEYISLCWPRCDTRTSSRRRHAIGSPGTPDMTPWMDFNPLWLQEFRATNVYELWERTTDSALFDIVEPSSTNNWPAREAVARTLTTGSTNFFNAVAGVRERWNARPSAPPSPNPGAGPSSGSSDLTATPVEVTKEDIEGEIRPSLAQRSSTSSSTGSGGARTSLSGWGAYLSSRAPRFSLSKGQEGASVPVGADGEPTAVDLSARRRRRASRPLTWQKRRWNPRSRGRFSFFTRTPSMASSAASMKSTASSDAPAPASSVPVSPTTPVSADKSEAHESEPVKADSTPTTKTEAAPETAKTNAKHAEDEDEGEGAGIQGWLLPCNIVHPAPTLRSW